MPQSRGRTFSAPATIAAAPLLIAGAALARSPADGVERRLNLVAADLQGLPAATIVNAPNNALRSDGDTLQQVIKPAGDTVERRVFPGVAHEFFGMNKVVLGRP